MVATTVVRASGQTVSAARPLKALFLSGGPYHDYGQLVPFLTTKIAQLVNVRFDVDMDTTLARLKNEDFARGYDVIIYDDCQTNADSAARARRAYGSRILQTAKFFNEGIEKVVYEPVVRNRLGLSSAGTVYTSPAWSMNVVYARLNSAGTFSTLILGAMLGFFRISASILYWCCGVLQPPATKRECKPE
jgi:hypothetical protein